MADSKFARAAYVVEMWWPGGPRPGLVHRYCYSAAEVEADIRHVWEWWQPQRIRIWRAVFGEPGAVLLQEIHWQSGLTPFGLDAKGALPAELLEGLPPSR